MDAVIPRRCQALIVLAAVGVAGLSLARPGGDDRHRDLTSFQHLYPIRAADGTWSVPFPLLRSGAYRVFADLVLAGGTGLTLSADLSVAGGYAPWALPELSRTATVDGYIITLDTGSRWTTMGWFRGAYEVAGLKTTRKSPPPFCDS
ncbi:hypothetical protein [Nonomuraea glycinis]|uniref:hypothetical protein n=1 Tax=Nonomuraea glycinis TaxID=2047744 RepID=UPI0033A6AC6E